MSKTETNNAERLHRQPEIANVLIVDDDLDLARFMLEILARKGIRGVIANDKKTAVEFLDRDSCDLVFASDRISRGADSSDNRLSGFELLQKIKTNSPDLPVIMIAKAPKQGTQNHQQTVETAVRAIHSGCSDFLIKPLDPNRIEKVLDTFLPNHSVSTIASALDGSRYLYRIVGKSAKMLQTVDLAKRVAPTSTPVLITGESGTGKELISYLVHHESKRANGPYVKVNCAALSDSLLESELFGHEKGAFTGAYNQRKGRFEMAHGGTLLLDEITETPIKFQAKLLRVLEQQDFERVGGNENVRVDVRIISTTNKDLLNEVQLGRFRQDLYYRLSGVRLVIAPMRVRRDDLPDLIWHFVNLYAREAQRHIAKLDPVMMDIFAKYHWPGNVRQLRNVVQTSLIFGVGETLSLADVSWLFDELQPLPQQQRSDFNGTLFCNKSRDVNSQQTHNWQQSSHTQNGLFADLSNSPQYLGLGGIPLAQVERHAILDTLRQTAGNQTKAAKVLGISDRTLRDKLHRYRQQGCLQSA